MYSENTHRRNTQCIQRIPIEGIRSPIMSRASNNKISHGSKTVSHISNDVKILGHKRKVNVLPIGTVDDLIIVRRRLLTV